MLKILIASEDAGRLAEIHRLSHLIGNYQAMPLRDGLAQLALHTVRLQMADVLVLELPVLGPAQMQGVRTLREQHPDLPCILVTPSPGTDLLIQAIRAGVSDVLAWPLEKTQFAEAMRRIEANHVPRAREGAQMLAFLSCKGGTGTSFLAANVGHALHTLGQRVLVIDLTRHFGDLAHLVSDKTPPSTLPDVCAQIDRLDAGFLDACLLRPEPGFDLLAGAGDPVRSGQVDKEKLDWVLSLLRPNYDFIVVDLGQGIDPLSLAVLDESRLVCTVVEPTIACARPGRRLLDILRALHYPADKLCVVANRSGRRNDLKAAELENIFGVRPRWTFPEDPAAVDESISHGEPVLAQHRRSAIAKAMVAAVTPLVSSQAIARRAGEAVSPLRRLVLRARGA